MLRSLLLITLMLAACGRPARSTSGGESRSGPSSTETEERDPPESSDTEEVECYNVGWDDCDQYLEPDAAYWACYGAADDAYWDGYCDCEDYYGEWYYC